MKIKSINTKKIVYSAMFIAIGLVLPFFTGQIKHFGNMLLPMHIPVFLCGLICNWKYGTAVGLILPLLRSVLFGMPILFPNAVAMAIELGAYGLIAGFLYERFKNKNLFALYISIVTAMLGGRVLWGLAQIVLLGFAGKSYAFTTFFTSSFVQAMPGIILQLVLLPSVMLLLKKTRFS